MAANSLWGSAAVKSLLGHLYSWVWGKCDLGYKLSKEAVQLAEESGDNYSQGIAFGAHGYSCFSKGYIEEAEKYLLKSVEFCNRSRQPSWNGAACIGLGDLYWENKNFKKSKENFEKGFHCLEDARIMPSFVNLAKIGLLRCKVAEDESAINLETLFSYSKNNRLKISEDFYRRWISEILGHMDGQHLKEAESWINQAIESDKRNGTNWSLGKDYLSYADLLIKKADPMKARENLGKAIETFQECGADGWVERVERKLAEFA
jgi:tetratricopeptide (TPR) repeat protein